MFFFAIETKIPLPCNKLNVKISSSKPGFLLSPDAGLGNTEEECYEAIHTFILALAPLNLVVKNVNKSDFEISKQKFAREIGLILLKYVDLIRTSDEIAVFTMLFYKAKKTQVLGRPYRYKFFKGCLTQILLCPFLNTLTLL